MASIGSPAHGARSRALKLFDALDKLPTRVTYFNLFFTPKRGRATRLNRGFFIVLRRPFYRDPVSAPFSWKLWDARGTTGRGRMGDRPFLQIVLYEDRRFGTDFVRFYMGAVSYTV